MARKDESRRGFLKKGAAGVAGMALLSPALEARGEDKAEESAQKLITRALGKTGITLPIVSMGARFGEPDQIRAALDAGIVHIDTAYTYGGGRHEEAVGEAVKDRPRDSFIVGTKIYMNMDGKTGLYPADARSEPFLEKFETSLTRLGLDYVDILYLHDVVKSESVIFEPYLSAMQKIKKDGKARFLGVSTHTNEPEVVRAAADCEQYDVVLTAYNFLIPHLEELNKAIDHATKAGLGVVAMKTQAGVYWDKERQQKINMTAALKWALGNPKITTAIPGFASFEEMETDLSVMADLALTTEEKKDLKLTAKGKAGLYCSQCGDCRGQCNRGLDIPTLMRSYMYAYGYRDLGAAKNAVRHMDLSQIPCDDCGQCLVTDCEMGFDVKGKVRDIARIDRVPDDFLG